MKIEIRGDHVLVDGYVNAVERESRVIPSSRGRFIEKVQAGAFERALQRAEDVELRFNHEKIIGSMKSGDVELFEDAIGLRAIAKVTDSSIIEKARNGELRGWSFGFIPNEGGDDWEDGENGISKRTIKDFELVEVSILDKTPAYIATSIEARGEEFVATERRSFENKTIVEDTKTEQRSKNTEISVFEKEIELLKLKGGN